MESKNLTRGEILTREEIDGRRSAGSGVVVVKSGDKFRIYSNGELCLGNVYEMDILKKNRSGAIVLHGRDKVECIPNINKEESNG